MVVALIFAPMELGIHRMHHASGTVGVDFAVVSIASGALSVGGGVAVGGVK